MIEVLSNLNEFLKPNIKKTLLTLPSVISLAYFYGLIFNKTDNMEFTLSPILYANTLALEYKILIIVLAYFISCSILKMWAKNKAMGLIAIIALTAISMWAILPIILYGIFTLYNNLTYDGGDGYPYEITAQDLSCKTSDDCGLTSKSCCSGCDGYALALNNNAIKKITEWQKHNCKPCFSTPDCMAEYSKSPFCLNNICKILKIPIFAYSYEFVNRTSNITAFSNEFREANQDYNFTDEQIKRLYGCLLNPKVDALKCAKIDS